MRKRTHLHEPSTVIVKSSMMELEKGERLSIGIPKCTVDPWVLKAIFGMADSCCYADGGRADCSCLYERRVMP